MKLIVKPHKIEITKIEDYNAGEYNIQDCEFQFSNEYTELTINNNIALVDNNSFTSGQTNSEWGIPVYIIGYKTGLFE